MIGLDTNVLVRYVTQDDPAQSAKASHLIESLTVAAPGFVSLVSVVELVWVLQSCYPCTQDASGSRSGNPVAYPRTDHRTCRSHLAGRAPIYHNQGGFRRLPDRTLCPRRRV